MITFNTIAFKNFLSYGSVLTTVNLNKPGTTAITGRDADESEENGTGSNGAGKTTILQALTYACYDKPLPTLSKESSMSKDDLINNINKQNMYVCVTFTKNNTSYIIERFRKYKPGGNYVKLCEDGKDITPDNVDNTNLKIEQILGMQYEIFVRIVAFSATTPSFFDLPNRSKYGPNQSDMIEELFNYKLMSEKAEVLNIQSKDTKQSLDINLTKMEMLKKEHERHDKQIISTIERVKTWAAQNALEIKELEEKLASIQGIDLLQQQTVLERINQIKKEIADKAKEIQITTSAQSTKTSKIEKLKLEIQELKTNTCPYCHQEFTNTKDKITEILTKVALFNQNINTLMLEVDTLTLEVDTLNKEQNNLYPQLTVTNLNELIDTKNKETQYITKVNDLQNAVNPFVSVLAEMEASDLDDINYDTINKLTELHDHQKFLLKLLTRKDSFIRKTILDKNLPILNKRLSHYLNALGLPHTVEFTKEMSTKISQLGRGIKYGNLSNGQKARINIGLSFAFRDIMQMIHQKVNVCMLDEILDFGLNASGVRNAAAMLEQKAKEENISMFIITHVEDVDNIFEQQLIVELDKGFSHIILGDDE
jgi:DNA repair exonuclease SbcCD ATPase subunit